MIKLSNILLNAKKAERHPIEMMFVGIFYASISIFLALWIFPDYVSIVMVFLTVISCIYVVQGAIILEEKKEKNINSEKTLFKQHFRTLSFLMFLFLGFLIAFAFWTIILPENLSSKIFYMQEQTINEIRTITGKSINPSSSLGVIIKNNLSVLFFSLLFSLFYGAGAIFILVWNASVLGFVIGIIAKQTLGLIHLPAIFFKYLLHGIPEMLAYFVIALAGGIIFISVLKDDLTKEKLKRISIDAGILILISIVLIILAGLIEIYISSNI